MRSLSILQHYHELCHEGDIPYSEEFRRVLQTRGVRSLSGVAIITVMTKPWPCPGKCLYCPSDARSPKSYLPSQPAMMRAILNEYHPYRQVATRLRALYQQGHPIDKVEIIVAGGTFSAYRRSYQTWFLSEVFRALNDGLSADVVYATPTRDGSQSRLSYVPNRERRSLQRLQERNERAACRCVGLSLETRPDWVSLEECVRMRTLGCTRVELGVQSVDEEVIALNRRGHTVEDVARATRCLRDFGFKVTYHMMLGLPGSTPERDCATFKELFSDERFFPDWLKIYPCLVLKNSELYRWWNEGKYRPYDDTTLRRVLAEIKRELPYSVRVVRVHRDIPSRDIVAGNVVANIREVVATDLRERGLGCRCIRCREVKGSECDDDEAIILFEQRFQTRGGVEWFLSFENKERTRLYSLLRLRLPDHDGWKVGMPLCVRDTALIRELHTYGRQARLRTGAKTNSQHRGYGKRLLARAEEIARESGYRTMTVIAGVGVRAYYRPLGYRLSETYMKKTLRSS